MKGALFAYQALGWAGLIAGLPLLGLLALRDSRYRAGWAERLGVWEPVPREAVWIHGASVGEMAAIAPVVKVLRERGVPLFLSATSVSGRDAAKGLAGPEGAARLLPLDLRPLVRRAVERAEPRALVVVETELWPALLWEARRAKVPAVLVNGRVSEHTFPRYRRLRRWLGPLLATFWAIQAQSEVDADRFRALGAPPDRVAVGGNLKFDLEAPNPSDPVVRALRRAEERGLSVVVAGSTHPGEEEAVARAVAALEGRGLRVGLVLAPRHLQRLGEVEDLLESRGRRTKRWTHLADPPGVSALQALETGRVVLVDGYGVVGRLYGGARCAFVGGTLAPVGGHNLLEPLSWGVPVLFGPNTQNCRGIRNQVLDRGLGTEVADPETLAGAMARYLTEAEQREAVRAGARALFDANRGAVGRVLQVLETLGVTGPAGADEDKG